MKEPMDERMKELIAIGASRGGTIDDYEE